MPQDRQFFLDSDAVSIFHNRETPLIEKGRKKLLKDVPTRKLVASIKRDIRQTIRASAAGGKPRRSESCGSSKGIMA